MGGVDSLEKIWFEEGLRIAYQYCNLSTVLFLSFVSIISGHGLEDCLQIEDCILFNRQMVLSVLSIVSR